jgi:Tfp pilus assembly protein PilO
MGSKNEKFILLAVLVGSVLIAVASGVTIYFVAKDTGVLRSANDGLHTRIATAKSKLNKLNDMRVEREKAQARLVASESILPSQKEIETLVDNLSEFAKQSGVTIVKAEPVRQSAYGAPIATTQRFDEADFNLNLTGNYFQFVEFLNYLENYKRFIRVDTFNIASAKNKTDGNSINLEFATFTYVDAAADQPTVTAVKGVTR